MSSKFKSHLVKEKDNIIKEYNSKLSAINFCIQLFDDFQSYSNSAEITFLKNYDNYADDDADNDNDDDNDDNSNGINQYLEHTSAKQSSKKTKSNDKNKGPKVVTRQRKRKLELDSNTASNKKTFSNINKNDILEQLKRIKNS